MSKVVLYRDGADDIELENVEVQVVGGSNLYTGADGQASQVAGTKLVKVKSAPVKDWDRTEVIRIDDNQSYRMSSKGVKFDIDGDWLIFRVK